MKLENYSTIKVLFLEELLIGTSSSDLSKILGYKFDKFRRWISNDSIFKTQDFYKLCEVLKLDLSHALDLFKCHLIQNDKEINLFKHLTDYNSIESTKELSEYLNAHPSVVKRYSKNEVDPNIEVIFKMMDYKAHHLPLFFKRLFHSKISHPIFRSWILENTHAPLVETSMPISAMIEAIISLERFQSVKENHEEFFSELLGVDKKDVEAVLLRMFNTGLIKKENGVISIVNNTTNLDGLTLQDVIPFIIHLNQKMIQVLEKRRDPNYQLPWTHGTMAYRVFPSSVESAQKINTILLKANSEILKTLESDLNPKTEARAILLQSFGITN